MQELEKYTAVAAKDGVARKTWVRQFLFNSTQPFYHILRQPSDPFVSFSADYTEGSSSLIDCVRQDNNLSSVFCDTAGEILADIIQEENFTADTWTLIQEVVWLLECLCVSTKDTIVQNLETVFFKCANNPQDKDRMDVRILLALAQHLRKHDHPERFEHLLPVMEARTANAGSVISATAVIISIQPSHSLDFLPAGINALAGEKVAIQTLLFEILKQAKIYPQLGDNLIIHLKSMDRTDLLQKVDEMKDKYFKL